MLSRFAGTQPNAAAFHPSCPNPDDDASGGQEGSEEEEALQGSEEDKEASSEEGSDYEPSE